MDELGGVTDTDPADYSRMGYQREAFRSNAYAGYAQGLNRVMHKGEEARTALSHVLNSVECGISLEAIEAACKTIRAHIGE